MVDLLIPGIVFSGSKRSNMCSAVLEVARSADIHVSVSSCKTFRYNCVKLQAGLFADCLEWHFQAAKRSDKSRTILQEGRFAHAQEYRFHGAKL